LLLGPDGGGDLIVMRFEFGMALEPGARFFAIFVELLIINQQKIARSAHVGDRRFVVGR